MKPAVFDHRASNLNPRCLLTVHLGLPCSSSECCAWGHHPGAVRLPAGRAGQDSVAWLGVRVGCVFVTSTPTLHSGSQVWLLILTGACLSVCGQLAGSPGWPRVASLTRPALGRMLATAPERRDPAPPRLEDAVGAFVACWSRGGRGSEAQSAAPQGQLRNPARLLLPSSACCPQTSHGHFRFKKWAVGSAS